MTKPGLLRGVSALCLLMLPAGAADEAAVDLFEGKVELKLESKKLSEDASLEAAADANYDKDSKLSLEVWRALRDLAAQAGQVRRRQMKPELEKILTELTASARLEAAAVEKLTAVMPLAIEEGMKDWEKSFCEWLTPYLTDGGGDPIAMLKSWKAEQLASNTGQFKITPPAKTSAWTEALKAILTPEQLKGVTDAEVAQRAKLLEEITPFLETAQGTATEGFTAAMELEVDKVIQYASLDEVRMKQLKDAADEAVKQTAKDWRTRAEGKILEMDEKSRKQMMAQSRGFGVNQKDKANEPWQREPWVSVRNNIFTAEEKSALETGLQQAKQRRLDALGMMTIAEMDRQIGFSAHQRQKVLDLARPHLTTLGTEFFESPSSGYYSLDSGQLLEKIRSIPVAELATILEKGQLARWKDLNPERMSGNRRYYRRVVNPGSPGKKEDEPDASDPWELERLTGLAVAHEAEKVVDVYVSQYEARVDSIARVNTLPPESIAVLMTAAKGAAERVSGNPIMNLDQNIRQQMQGVKPGEAAARLKALSTGWSENRQGVKDPPLWKATLERVLTAPQQETWKQECRAMELWQMRSTSALVATEVEKFVRISPEKHELLVKKLETVLEEYLADITNFLSAGWQLQSYYSCIPVAFLSEAELKEIFSATEIEKVRTRCLGQAQQYADMIKQQHTRRKKK